MKWVGRKAADTAMEWVGKKQRRYKKGRKDKDQDKEIILEYCQKQKYVVKWKYNFIKAKLIALLLAAGLGVTGIAMMAQMDGHMILSYCTVCGVRDTY